MTNLRDLTQPELKSIRDGFGEGFLRAGEQYPQVLGLSADLTESVRMHKFAEKFPERFFQVGIAEQNMAGIAAGLGLEGYVPYIGSFANFSPGRNYDQIRISICMMNSNVKIVSSHAGLSYGEDGMSVQMLEDIAMMRALPNMKIIVPADAEQAAQATEALATIEGPAYLRLGRAETPLLFADHDFEFGKAQLLREGDAATVVACGYMVFRALVAADELAREGIQVEVINAHTLKPFDEETLIRSLLKTRAVVTAEDAQKFGGLGGIVAEITAKNVPVPQEFVAVNDIFGQSGTSLELNKSRGLMPEDIVAAVRRVIVRKL